MAQFNSRAVLHLMLGGSVAGIGAPALSQATGEGTGALSEIVVTAQKREQNLQEVPIAISAIGTEKIEQLNIRDSRDLSGLAPNVTITQGTTSGAAAVISIRGIPTPASETFGLDTSNALYVDGVYIARSGASGLDVMDIERVEVLRGPQGTLFGRNTTGGAIAFISRQPSSEFRLKADASYGNFNAWNGRLVIDPGEILGIATSFSYSHRQRNGVVDNILEPRDSKDPGAYNSDSFRAAARVELGGTGSIQYIFDWTELKSSPNAFMLTNVADGTPRPPVLVDGQLVERTQVAPVAQYLAAATFAQPECRSLATPTRNYRERICNDISSFSVDKIWGHNLQIENDFDLFRIKMTTGYRMWRNSSNSDLDGMGAFSGPAFSNASLFNGMPASLLQFIPTIPPAARPIIASLPVPTVTQNLFDTNNVRRHKQLSHEIEVAGDTDTLDWVVGGFYFWEKGSEDNPQNSGFVLDTNTIFLRNFGALGPSFVAANPARYRLVQTRGVLRYTAGSESTAVYGQFTFYPGGRDSGLKLTAGGRYTWDTKTISRSNVGTTVFSPPEFDKASFSKFTWNLMAGYDLADGVNLYGRIATGYRSGGFNASDALLDSFKPESLISYELGLKSELFNRRLRFNVAAYHNIYDDLAVNIPLTNAPPGTFQSRVGNAGKVTYTGFEAEVQAVVNDNFSIDGSLGYVDIKFKELLAGDPVVPGAPPVNIASIAKPGYTSPFTANAAINAQFPLNWDEARLTARVGYTYEDGKYSFNNSLSVPFNEEIKGDNRSLVDAQIGVDRITLGRGAQGEIRIWGKNLTNSKDFVRGVDFGSLGFAGGYYADPRTYGVTIGVKY